MMARCRSKDLRYSRQAQTCIRSVRLQPDRRSVGCVLYVGRTLSGPPSDSDAGPDKARPTARHSCRSATIGSTCAARRAGTYAASIPDAVSTRHAPIRVARSWGSTPKSSVRIDKATTIASGAPRRQPQGHQPESVAQDHALHGPGRRAERHADSEFGGASGHGVHHDTEETHAREAERQDSENGGHTSDQPLLPQTIRHLVGQHRHAVDRKTGINFAHRPSHLGGDRSRIAGGAHVQRSRFDGHLRQRIEGHRPRGVLNAVDTRIFHDADDLGVDCAVADAPADSAPIGKKRRAIARLTMATFGVFSLSRSSKPRPSRRRMPVVAK